MGYKIFSARKCQLTGLKNKAYAEMMLKWNEQTMIGEDKSDAMEINTDKTSSENSRYSNQRNSIFSNYDGQITAKYASLDSNMAAMNANNEQVATYQAQQANYSQNDQEYIDLQAKIDTLNLANTNLTNSNTVINNDISQLESKRDNELSNAQSDHENKVHQYKSEYDITLQNINNEETKIEKRIQILETHVSEYTQEMAKAEQQEATEIKTCIPNYNGAGGGN